MSTLRLWYSLLFICENDLSKHLCNITQCTWLAKMDTSQHKRDSLRRLQMRLMAGPRPSEVEKKVCYTKRVAKVKHA